MTRLRALNESISDDSEEEVEEKETIEAQEERAFSQYKKALALRQQAEYSEAEELLIDLLNDDFLASVNPGEKRDGSDGLARPAVALKYACLKNLGGILVLHDRANDGLSCLIQAAELDDTDVTLWQQMGNVALQVNDFHLASHAFQEGLRCNPRHWPCLDSLLPLLYAINDYHGCLLLVARTLQLDPEYPQALALRDQIAKEQPSLTDNFKHFFPNEEDINQASFKVEEAEAVVVIAHAQSLRERWIKACEVSEADKKTSLDGEECVELKTKSWFGLGKCLLQTYNSINSNKEASFLKVIKIHLPETNVNGNDVSNGEKTEAEGNCVVSTGPIADADSEVMEVDSEQEAKPEDQTEEDATEASGQEQEQEDEGGTQNTSESKEKPSTSKRKRRHTSMSLMDQWSKRRSGRRSTRKAEEREEVNLASRFRSFLPDSLLPNNLEAEILRANRKRLTRDPMELLSLGEDSMDTMELYRLLQERDAVEQQQPQRRPLGKEDIMRLTSEEKYFGTESEELDVLAFLKHHGGGCENVIELISEYVRQLAYKEHLTWPLDLIPVYTEAYACKQKHFSHLAPGCSTETAANQNMDLKALLLYCELCIDAWQQKDPKIREDITGEDSQKILSAIGHLMLHSSQSHLFSSSVEQCKLLLRIHWLKAQFFLLQDNASSAIYSLQDVLDGLDIVDGVLNVHQNATSITKHPNENDSPGKQQKLPGDLKHSHERENEATVEGSAGQRSILLDNCIPEERERAEVEKEIHVKSEGPSLVQQKPSSEQLVLTSQDEDLPMQEQGQAMPQGAICVSVKSEVPGEYSSVICKSSTSMKDTSVKEEFNPPPSSLGSDLASEIALSSENVLQPSLIDKPPTQKSQQVLEQESISEEGSKHPIESVHTAKPSEVIEMDTTEIVGGKNLAEFDGQQRNSANTVAKPQIVSLEAKSESGQAAGAPQAQDNCASPVEVKENVGLPTVEPTPVGNSNGMFSLVLTNSHINSSISKVSVEQLLTSLTRQQQLSAVDELYESQQYEAVAGTLTECFKYCAQQADTDNVSENDEVDTLPDRPTQMAMLLGSLWQLQKYSECFYWAEACLHESFNRYMKSTEAEKEKDNQQIWTTSTEKLLAGMESCLNVAGQASLDRLPSTRLTRLVETLTSILCLQLDQSDTSVAMAFECTTPWVILYQVVLFEEQRQPKKIDVIPSSMSVLFTAHDYMARHSRCCLNEGVLLNLILEVVVPQLRSSELVGVRDELNHQVEQAIFCMFNHPKKGRESSRKRLQDHKVANQLNMTWEQSLLLLSFYDPDELPTYDSTYKISADEEQLFLLISKLIPEECNPNKYMNCMKEYIRGKSDSLPAVSSTLPESAHNIYYLLADFYMKTHKWDSAVKFYMLDVCMNPMRFDSWAGMALARATNVTISINSCVILKNEVFLLRTTEAQLCFQSAVDLDPGSATLWIEYGNFVYVVHSFCSRLLKMETDSLSIEMFNKLEEEKDKLLALTEKCFREADKLGQDEGWLHQYMLGKVAEKRGENASVFLKHYREAAFLLAESNAEYPLTLNYDPPQTYAFEAHEVHYRIHASILKYLETIEGKVLDADTKHLFETTIAEASQSPFMMVALNRGQPATQGADSQKAAKRKPNDPSPEASEKRSKVTENNVVGIESQRTGETRVLKEENEDSKDSKQNQAGELSHTKETSNGNGVTENTCSPVVNDFPELPVDESVKNHSAIQVHTSKAAVTNANLLSTDTSVENMALDHPRSLEHLRESVLQGKIDQKIGNVSESTFNVDSESGMNRSSISSSSKVTDLRLLDPSKVVEDSSAVEILVGPVAQKDVGTEMLTPSNMDSLKCKTLCSSVNMYKPTQTLLMPQSQSHVATNDSQTSNSNVLVVPLCGVDCVDGVGVSRVDKVHGISSLDNEHDYAAPFKTEEHGSVFVDTDLSSTDNSVANTDCTILLDSDLENSSLNLPASSNSSLDAGSSAADSSGAHKQTVLSVVSGSSNIPTKTMQGVGHKEDNEKFVECIAIEDTKDIEGCDRRTHPDVRLVDMKTDVNVMSVEICDVDTVSTQETSGGTAAVGVRAASQNERVECNKKRKREGTENNGSSSSDGSSSSSESENKNDTAKKNDRVTEEKIKEKETSLISLSASQKLAVSSETSDHENLVNSCLNAMEECLVRYPRHYKSLYRLCHYYFRSKKNRNLKRCRQLFLGDYRISRMHKNINGLFKCTAINAMFNDMWRIPVEEVDRAGSFASHMSRCVVLLMELLRDQQDHPMLLKLSVFLKKEPEKKDKKYLRDNERVDLSKQALAMCIAALRVSVNQTRCVNNVLEIFSTVKDGIKDIPQKEAVFKAILIDAYRKLKDIKTDTVVYEIALEFCQSEVNLRKAQAQIQAQAAQAQAQAQALAQAQAQVQAQLAQTQLASVNIQASLLGMGMGMGAFGAACFGMHRFPLPAPAGMASSSVITSTANSLYLPQTAAPVTVQRGRGRGRSKSHQRFNSPILPTMGVGGLNAHQAPAGTLMQLAKQEQQKRQQLAANNAASTPSSRSSVVSEIAKDRPAISITPFQRTSQPLAVSNVITSSSLNTSSSNTSRTSSTGLSIEPLPLPTPAHSGSVSWATSPRPNVPVPAGSFNRQSIGSGVSQVMPSAPAKDNIPMKAARKSLPTNAPLPLYPGPRPYVPRAPVPKDIDNSVALLSRLPGLQVKQRPRGGYSVLNKSKALSAVFGQSKVQSQKEREAAIARRQLEKLQAAKINILQPKPNVSISKLQVAPQSANVPSSSSSTSGNNQQKKSSDPNFDVIVLD